MRNLIGISNFILLLLSLALIGCTPAGTVITEKPHSQSSETKDKRGFDPLEFPGDKTIVAMEHPQKGTVGLPLEQSPDSVAGILSVDTTRLAPTMPEDTLINQVYRVQIATTRLFGEAREIVNVAEEIFDMPVVVDYEVPNFKVRVGGFTERTQAEAYQKKCRTAGYKNAWVVMVNVNVKSLEPLYQDLPAMVPFDTLNDDSTDNELAP